VEIEAGELSGFYYFESNPPNLDYGLGLRPELTGQGLDWSSSWPASRSRARPHSYLRRRESRRSFRTRPPVWQVGQ